MKKFNTLCESILEAKKKQYSIVRLINKQQLKLLKASLM